MKKSLIYTLIFDTLFASTGLTAIISNVAATETSDASSTSTVTTSDFSSPTTAKLPSTNESVYIITDATGNVNSSFIGSTINTSNNPLPLSMQITYQLNGNPISADELAGKSGHIKITYNFSSTKSYQNKLVPFLTVAGITLDNAKFTNVKIDHGKIISETDNIILAGYATPGLNSDLNTDFLPDSFTIEADTTDFALNNVYIFATNDIFADFDTSKLSSIDNIVNSINELATGLDRILVGATDLTDGLDTAFSGFKELQSGIKQLANGATKLNSGTKTISTGASNLATGIDTLNTGLSQLSANSTALNQGATQIFSILLASTSAEIGQTLTRENYAIILTNIINQLAPVDPERATKLSQTKALLDSYNSFLTKLAEYTGAIDDIATKTPTLAAGANSLATGTDELSTGAESLAAGIAKLDLGADTFASGMSQLATGSHTLKDGLTTFKTEGITKLVNFANQDLTSFTYNLRKTVDAAKSYHSYSDQTAKSIKFIFKTPTIK